jgi:hypothetical protein
MVGPFFYPYFFSPSIQVIDFSGFAILSPASSVFAFIFLKNRTSPDILCIFFDINKLEILRGCMLVWILL